MRFRPQAGQDVHVWPDFVSILSVGQRETEGAGPPTDLAGSRSGLVGLLTVTHPLPSDTPGGRVCLCRGQRPSFRGRCAGLG